MNNNFNFRDFEIIKKGSQGTIIKASDNKGCLFAIKIDKKPSSISSPSYPALLSSSFPQSPSLHSPSTGSSSPLPPSSFIFPPLRAKGSHIKEKDFLIELQGIKGIPKFFWGGFDPEIERFVIVEELTGRDLKYYLNKFKKFSLFTTLKIALQLLKILRSIHEKGVIHRDLKPDNLALSRNGKDILLLDFGLARSLLRAKENKEGKIQMKFVGNLMFCGLNAHSFKNDTKVDDLVSLGILVIYFLQGNLDWEYKETSSFSSSVEKIWLKKVKFLSKKMPTRYPFFYPYFKHLCSVKNDSINYDFLENVIETWAHVEKIDLNSETWDWSKENKNRDSLDTDCENEESSKENFQEESGEAMVSELMINYRVPNL